MPPATNLPVLNPVFAIANFFPQFPRSLPSRILSLKWGFQRWLQIGITLELLKKKKTLLTWGPSGKSLIGERWGLSILNKPPPPQPGPKKNSQG